MRISDWSSDVCSSDLAFWMRDHDYGYLAAILGGFAVGVAVLVIGQFLFTVIRSPIVRLAIALLFAIPAGIAGYHAVQEIGRASCREKCVSTCISRWAPYH